MKVNKYLALGICLIAVLSIIGMFNVLRFDTNLNVEAKPSSNISIKIVNCTITSISNGTITVESDEFSGEIAGGGKWFFLYNGTIGLGNWSKICSYIKEGSAEIVFLLNGGNESTLLALKQGDLKLFKYLLVKHNVVKHLGTRNYFSVYGKILYKGKNFLLVSIRGYRVIVFIGAESKWYKAGGGIVTWSEVSSEFNVGDTIRIFYHSIVIFKNTFAKYSGFSAIITGYSGAIIDLTSGVSISRYIEG